MENNDSSSLFVHQDWAKSVEKKKLLDRLTEKSMFAYPTWADSFSNEKEKIPVTKNWDQISGISHSNFNELLKKPATTNNTSTWNQFSGISALTEGGKTRIRKSKRTKKTKRSKKSRRHKK